MTALRRLPTWMKIASIGTMWAGEMLFLKVGRAARAMAQFRVDQPAGRLALLILLLGGAAAASAMATWDHPIWWVFTVASVAFAPFAVRAQLGGREAAQRYLNSIGGGAGRTRSTAP
jgi:hypothetical protein